MGIFEIIILICATIIFIILVRRFPDTSENARHSGGGTDKRFHLNMPHMPMPKMAKLKPKMNVNLSGWWSKKTPVDPVPFDEPDATPKTEISVKPKQFEPGTSPEELEKLGPHIRQILSDANKYLDSHQTDLAEKLYLRAAADEPTCVLAYSQLGTIYLQKDSEASLVDAEEAFRQAYKFAPDNGYLLNNMGLVALKKGLSHEAISFFDQAIAVDSNVAERHANLGQAYLESRQYSKAVRHFVKAWALDPDNLKYKEMLDDAKERERRLRSNRG